MTGSFEDILKKENITMEDLEEFQKIYDERFVDEKFTGFEKVRHTTLHLGKLLGRLTSYCEAIEQGEPASAEEIKKKVIPDLLVYCFWLAKEFGVNPAQEYLERMIGNIERLYSSKSSEKEIAKLRELLKIRKEELAIVYMVAGVSSRFGGKIKQFAKVTDNETLIEYSLNQALPAGFTKIVFIVGNKTEIPFREKFGNSYKGIPIEYCLQTYNPEQRDKPFGTADALCSAQNFLTSPFIICNGDDLYGETTFKILVEHLKNKNTCATIGYRLGEVLSENGGVNRGIFKTENNKVLSIDETLDITKENLISKGLSEEDLCSQNIFVLFPEVIKHIKEAVERFKEDNKNDRKAECYLPKELHKLIEQNKIIIELYLTPDKWLGVTNPNDELIIKEQIKKLFS